MARIQDDDQGNSRSGTSGTDLMFGAGGSDTLNGGDGNDAIYGYGVGAAAANEAIAATRIASGLSRPLYMTQAPDQTNRAFILEQHSGLVKIIDLTTGAINATPFLDIGTQISTGGEQGLLGLAFHPNYASNGLFYVNFTAGNGDTRIVEYRVSAGNPNQADAGSARNVLTFAQPYTNHNGGWIGFGPDGYLYISSGDGGGSGDPQQNGQNYTTLLGKILRIDVDSRTGSLGYGIPGSNPFVGTGLAEEIWAGGLRNPWRMSFDFFTGDLWFGDVGEGAREEVNFQPAGSGGQNYGWGVLEGTHVFRPGLPTDGIAPPVFEYDRSLGQSVTGGYVYRGPAAGFEGEYFFGDFVFGRVWSMYEEGGVAGRVADRTSAIAPNVGSVNLISSFAQDRAGNVYIIGLDGEIHRLDLPVNRGDAGNTLDGGNGDDRLYGGTGADQISGGAGLDTAWFPFVRSQYFIDTLNDGSGRLITRIVDGLGREGTDTLDTVERVTFSDANIVLAGTGLDKTSNVVGTRFDDIVFHHAGQGRSVAHQFIDGAHQTVVQRVTGNQGSVWQAVDTGDLNSDGRADVVYQNTANGAISIGVMTPAGVTSFVNITQSLSAQYRVAGVADVDGDAYNDIVLQNRATGEVHFADMTNTSFGGWRSVSTFGTAWQVSALGDVNRDGVADIIFQNNANGAVSAGRMTTGGTIAGFTPVGAANGWTVREAGDANNDGFADVFMQNNLTGDIVYQSMANGTASGYRTVLGGYGTAWRLEGLADINNDGDVDAVIRNTLGSGDTYVVNLENGVFQSFTPVVGGVGPDWYVV